MLLVLAVLGALGVVIGGKHLQSHRFHKPVNRQKLLLLSGLPLLFNEDFSVAGSGSPLLSSLGKSYEVVPISVTDAPELAKASVLLMAQPQAQTAENLVALDQWVRRGGRLLLFADPLLEWPSKLPLGDVTRPPPMFEDTGLLAHWGLHLRLPERRGPAVRMLGGYRVLTVSPGSLDGPCRISADGLVAHCSVGAGTATIVADADLLDIQDLGPAAADNVAAVESELAALARS